MICSVGKARDCGSGKTAPRSLPRKPCDHGRAGMMPLKGSDELWHRTPLRTTQDGKLTDHVDSVLLADNLGLKRLKNEPMLLRKLSKVSP